MWRDSRNITWLSFGLAFVGGYGDAASYILADTFTGHVTGNLVLVAISVAGHDWPVCWRRLSAIAFFLAGTLFSIIMERLVARRPGWSLLPIVMGIEIVLISIGYVALTSHLLTRLELYTGCMSLALGMQNGAFWQAGGITVRTTYLTGAITGLLMTQAQRHGSPAAPASCEQSAHGPKVSLLHGIWVSFVLGAGIGAAMVFRFKALAMFGAALVLLAMILVSPGSSGNGTRIASEGDRELHESRK